MPVGWPGQIVEVPMKIKKILLGLVIAVVLLVVVALVVVGLTLDGIVKKGVETYGPQITKVEVKLESVRIGLLSGSAAIKGLAVGNPEGYKAPHSITADLISVGIDSGSLLKDKIVVRSIRLESPEITFEGGLIKNNLKTLMDNLSGTNTSTAAESAPAEPGKKLEVDDFLIVGAKVHVVGGNTTVTIPEIHLTNLGTGPEGITARDLTQRVLAELVNATLKEVASSGLLQGTEKAAGEAVGKAARTLGDLFKKKE